MRTLLTLLFTLLSTVVVSAETVLYSSPKEYPKHTLAGGYNFSEDGKFLYIFWTLNKYPGWADYVVEKIDTQSNLRVELKSIYLDTYYNAFVYFERNGKPFVSNFKGVFSLESGKEVCAFPSRIERYDDYIKTISNDASRILVADRSHAAYEVFNLSDCSLVYNIDNHLENNDFKPILFDSQLINAYEFFYGLDRNPTRFRQDTTHYIDGVVAKIYPTHSRGFIGFNTLRNQMLYRDWDAARKCVFGELNSGSVIASFEFPSEQPYEKCAGQWIPSLSDPRYGIFITLYPDKSAPDARSTYAKSGLAAVIDLQTNQILKQFEIQTDRQWRFVFGDMAKSFFDSRNNVLHLHDNFKSIAYDTSTGANISSLFSDCTCIQEIEAVPNFIACTKNYDGTLLNDTYLIDLKNRTSEKIADKKPLSYKTPKISSQGAVAVEEVGYVIRLSKPKVVP